jgi:hypothetical protein
VAIERRPRFSTLVASVPLSEAGWQPLAEGELLVVRSGTLVPDEPTGPDARKALQ